MKEVDANGGVQVIARAAQLLRALEGEPLGLSLAQLADRVGLPRSTVHRIVTALTVEGFLISASPSARVRIGPEFARLAAAGTAELWRPIEPYLRKMADELGETVDCSLLEGDHVRVIHVIPTTQHTLRAIAEVGQTFPLYSSAKGKALLSAQDWSTAQRMIPAVLEDHTPYTITSIEEIEAELERVRAAGIAYDQEENTLGVCAAAIAVHEPAGTLLAISVVVPAQRFHNLQSRITKALRETGEEIARAAAVDAELQA